MSVHSWGESPFGNWIVSIENADPEKEAYVDNLELLIWGTFESPDQ